MEQGMAARDVRVAELADAPGLGPGTSRCGGSSPSAHTSQNIFMGLEPRRIFVKSHIDIRTNASALTACESRKIKEKDRVSIRHGSKLNTCIGGYET